MIADAPVSGVQAPRIRSVPAYDSSTGQEAVELAAMAGLFLDPWQSQTLVDALGERSDGRWAAREVGVVVSRQNGKGSLLEARELAGLFLLRERLQLHTAHQFKTCAEHFLRVKSLIENTDALRKRCKKPRIGTGEEQIETLDGCRLRFIARSRASARGFTADMIALDEAFELPEAAMNALGPTLLTRPNHQLWFTSSAVDQLEHPNGLVLARLRARGMEGAERLAYFEWSADIDLSDPDAYEKAGDPQMWAQANPGLGRRIDLESFRGHYLSAGQRGFLIEYLSVGDWPSLDPDAGSAIDPKLWAALADVDAERGDSPVFGVDVDQARAGHIAVGWVDSAGGTQVMVSDSGVPAARMAARLNELRERWGGAIVLGGPSADLADEIPGASVASVADFAAASGRLEDLVKEGAIHHGNQPELNDAVRASRWRSAGTSGERAIQLKDCPGIGPLAAVIRAVHGLDKSRDPVMNCW